MTIFGWDASDFDHARGMRASHIEKAEQEGIRFFTHKISEGIHVTHVHCGDKLRAAVNAGIPFVGAYVVVRTPAPSVSAQVDYAISELTKQWSGWKSFAGFFWQVDLERWEYDSVAPKHGVEMCRLLESRTGKGVILYAPKWAYGDNISGDDWLWASSYGQNVVGGFRALYPGDNSTRWGRYSGRVPVVLQYGSRAIIGGQRTCDANAFRGSVEQFARIINAEVDMALTTDDIGKVAQAVYVKFSQKVTAEMRAAKEKTFPVGYTVTPGTSHRESWAYGKENKALLAKVMTEQAAQRALLQTLATQGAGSLSPEQFEELASRSAAAIENALAEARITFSVEDEDGSEQA